MMGLSFIVVAVIAVGVCGLLIAAIVAVVWVIVQEREDKD